MTYMPDCFIVFFVSLTVWSNVERTMWEPSVGGQSELTISSTRRGCESSRPAARELADGLRAEASPKRRRLTDKGDRDREQKDSREDVAVRGEQRLFSSEIRWKEERGWAARAGKTRSQTSRSCCAGLRAAGWARGGRTRRRAWRAA